MGALLSQPVMDSGGKAECWSRWGMEEAPACQGPATIPRQSRQSGDGKSSALKSIMCHLRMERWWRGDAVPESQHVTDSGFQSWWHNFIRTNKLNIPTVFFFLNSCGRNKAHVNFQNSSEPCVPVKVQINILDTMMACSGETSTKARQYSLLLIILKTVHLPECRMFLIFIWHIRSFSFLSRPTTLNSIQEAIWEMSKTLLDSWEAGSGCQ